MLNPLQSKNVIFKWLVAHVLILALSNYLVQFPVAIFGTEFTWGTFTFPIIFLLSDLCSRVYGKQVAQKVVFYAMVPALMISYVTTTAFFEGKFLGLGALMSLNIFAARIVVASLTAYVIGQLIDIQIFNALRQNKHWWLAPMLSSFIAGFVDTFWFYGIAFYQSSNLFLAQNWITIAGNDYAFKLAFYALALLPAYGSLLKIIEKVSSKSLRYQSSQS